MQLIKMNRIKNIYCIRWLGEVYTAPLSRTGYYITGIDYPIKNLFE